MIPEVPRPVYKPVKEKKGKKSQPSDPYHVKMIKQTVFEAILSTKGKGNVYQGERPGTKFGLFEETETAGEESEEESGEIIASEAEETEFEEKPEGRTKAKHDLKRKATDKPSVGGSSKQAK